jgi:hypothetical protein
MRKLIYPLMLLWLAGTITGCASMSKKDCENANWHAIGYNDGARGIQPGHLNVYSQRCAEYKIVPDAGAYQAGWNEGIRSYCTNANGYQAGAAGLAYNNICPADVAPAYLAGYRQGLDQYCTPDNGLRQGLAGRPYRGVCPADMAGAFQNHYRLGQDVRRARDMHHSIEYRLAKVRKALAGEKHPKRYHDLLHDLAHLRHEEEHSEATQAALQACMGNDWYDVGLTDGESGQPYRAGKIAGICRSYGSPADAIGYRQGWRDGISHYCTYESGVYAGQNNLEYRGVCHGPNYLLFWGGYLKGLGLFRAGRYEDHPRPVYRHTEHRERRRSPANKAQRHRQPQPRHQAKPQRPHAKRHGKPQPAPSHANQHGKSQSASSQAKQHGESKSAHQKQHGDKEPKDKQHGNPPSPE